MWQMHVHRYVHEVLRCVKMDMVQDKELRMSCVSTLSSITIEIKMMFKLALL